MSTLRRCLCSSRISFFLVFEIETHGIYKIKAGKGEGAEEKEEGATKTKKVKIVLLE